MGWRYSTQPMPSSSFLSYIDCSRNLLGTWSKTSVNIVVWSKSYVKALLHVSQLCFSNCNCILQHQPYVFEKSNHRLTLYYLENTSREVFHYLGKPSWGTATLQIKNNIFQDKFQLSNCWSDHANCGICITFDLLSYGQELFINSEICFPLNTSEFNLKRVWTRLFYDQLDCHRFHSLLIR